MIQHLFNEPAYGPLRHICGYLLYVRIVESIVLVNKAFKSAAVSSLKNRGIKIKWWVGKKYYNRTAARMVRRHDGEEYRLVFRWKPVLYKKFPLQTMLNLIDLNVFHFEHLVELFLFYKLHGLKKSNDVLKLRDEFDWWDNDKCTVENRTEDVKKSTPNLNLLSIFECLNETFLNEEKVEMFKKMFHLIGRSKFRNSLTTFDDQYYIFGDETLALFIRDVWDQKFGKDPDGIIRTKILRRIIFECFVMSLEALLEIISIRKQLFNLVKDLLPTICENGFIDNLEMIMKLFGKYEMNFDSKTWMKCFVGASKFNHISVVESILDSICVFDQDFLKCFKEIVCVYDFREQMEIMIKKIRSLGKPFCVNDVILNFCRNGNSKMIRLCFENDPFFFEKGRGLVNKCVQVLLKNEYWDAILLFLGELSEEVDPLMMDFQILKRAVSVGALKVVEFYFEKVMKFKEHGERLREFVNSPELCLVKLCVERQQEQVLGYLIKFYKDDIFHVQNIRKSWCIQSKNGINKNTLGKILRSQSLREKVRGLKISTHSMFCHLLSENPTEEELYRLYDYKILTGKKIIRELYVLSCKKGFDSLTKAIIERNESELDEFSLFNGAKSAIESKESSFLFYELVSTWSKTNFRPPIFLEVLDNPFVLRMRLYFLVSAILMEKKRERKREKRDNDPCFSNLKVILNFFHEHHLFREHMYGKYIALFLDHVWDLFSENDVVAKKSFQEEITLFTKVGGEKEFLNFFNESLKLRKRKNAINFFLEIFSVFVRERKFFCENAHPGSPFVMWFLSNEEEWGQRNIASQFKISFLHYWQVKGNEPNFEINFSSVFEEPESSHGKSLFGNQYILYSHKLEKLYDGELEMNNMQAVRNFIAVSLIYAKESDLRFLELLKESFSDGFGPLDLEFLNARINIRKKINADDVRETLTYLLLEIKYEKFDVGSIGWHLEFWKEMCRDLLFQDITKFGDNNYLYQCLDDSGVIFTTNISVETNLEKEMERGTALSEMVENFPECEYVQLWKKKINDKTEFGFYKGEGFFRFVKSILHFETDPFTISETFAVFEKSRLEFLEKYVWTKLSGEEKKIFMLVCKKVIHGELSWKSYLGLIKKIFDFLKHNNYSGYSGGKTLGRSFIPLVCFGEEVDINFLGSVRHYTSKEYLEVCCRGLIEFYPFSFIMGDGRKRAFISIFRCGVETRSFNILTMLCEKMNDVAMVIDGFLINEGLFFLIQKREKEIIHEMFKIFSKNPNFNPQHVFMSLCDAHDFESVLKLVDLYRHIEFDWNLCFERWCESEMSGSSSYEKYEMIIFEKVNSTKMMNNGFVRSCASGNVPCTTRVFGRFEKFLENESLREGCDVACLVGHCEIVELILDLILKNRKENNPISIDHLNYLLLMTAQARHFSITRKLLLFAHRLNVRIEINHLIQAISNSDESFFDISEAISNQEETRVVHKHQQSQIISVIQSLDLVGPKINNISESGSENNFFRN